MNQLTRNSITLGFAWTGPVFVITYLIFWIGFGHNFPPPNVMGMTASELVSDYYLKYQSDIKLGMTGSTVVGLLYMAWSCVLASMLNQSGENAMFSNLELAGGLLTGWLLAFCPAIWLACAMYAETMHPDIILMVHTFTWFIYDMTYMITTLQLAGLGLYTMFSTDQKVFPRWAGWAAVTVGIIFIPLSLIPYVESGPFTIPGIWNFYIVFGTWGFAFFSVYSYYMLKELYRQRRELQGHPVPQAA